MSLATITAMESRLARWELDGDRRAVFLDCYTRMTRAMDTAVRRGDFDDADWVTLLLDRFAGYYFDADEAWERDEPTLPGPWRLAHDATRREGVATLQLLLVGVNAHINFDLVLTLVDLMGDLPLDQRAAELDRRRRDYDRVNDVIAATADEVQDEVVERYAPRLDLADRWLGRIDEWAAVRLLTGWRDGVWRCASGILLDVDDRRPTLVDRRCAGCERRSRRILLRR